jgi:hypothetical protein
MPINYQGLPTTGLLLATLAHRRKTSGLVIIEQLQEHLKLKLGIQSSSEPQAGILPYSQQGAVIINIIRTGGLFDEISADRYKCSLACVQEMKTGKLDGKL